MKKTMLICSVIILLLSACSNKNLSPSSARNTIIKSTDLINEDLLAKNFVLIQKNAQDEMSNRFFVYIPLTLQASSLESATETLTKEMIERYGADLLTNVRIETNWLITIYYNRYTYYITADVWRRKI